MSTSNTMDFRTASAQFTSGDTFANAKKAADAIRRDLADSPAMLLIYFASTCYDPDTLAQEMHTILPGAITIGATSAGEAVDDKMLNSSVVVMAFGPGVFNHCRFGLVVGPDQRPAPENGIFSSARAALAFSASGTNSELIDLDYRKFFGLILADKMTAFTESVLERIGEATDAIFVGGFAGDDYKFTSQQYVFYNGHAYRSAAVVGLLEPARGFSLLKTQAVDMTDHVFTITRADEKERIIWELDNRPAAQVYAECIGVDKDKLSIFDFDECPFALMMDGEPFIRAIVRPVQGRGLQTFAAVHTGTRLTITKAGDVLNTTAKALQDKWREMDGYRALVHINCASRYTALKNWKQIDCFSSLFGNVPSIAFSSYGEIYVGIVAMTSTMILFK